MQKTFREQSILKNLTGLIFIFIGACLNAQSLDGIKDQKPLLVNGFISTNQIMNTQPTDTGNISIYSGYYTGNLNFSIYGVSVPLTFIYSNNRGNFSHPFNQYGMQPTYNWAKGYVGYSSMNFTPYTLNGHLFFGAGVEVDPPGLFYGSAMYGRLKRAVEPDSLNLNQVAAFKRMGYGFRAGIAASDDHLDISLFRAYDVVNSVHNPELQNQLLPQDNSVMSVSFKKHLFPNLIMHGEYASSFLTTDTRTEKAIVENAILKPPVWFMPFRTSTIQRNAIKSNLTYRLNSFSIGVGYERVDPEYRTLGAYYFSNNMENITLNFSANFLDNKVSLAGNTGLQKDNLDNIKMNNTNRFVGSANVGFVPDEKLNFNIAYSNFTSFTNVRSTFDFINETDPFQNYDTLNFRQISQHTSFNSTYVIDNSQEKRQSVNFYLNWQVSNDKQGRDSVSVSNFYNANASYIINISQIDLTCNVSINFNRNDMNGAGSRTWGPVVGMSKMFLDKTLRTSLTASYNVSNTEGQLASNTINIRMGTVYSLERKHNFSANILYQQRKNPARSFNTFNVTFGYVYNFNF